jgi:hypothetical protein
MTNIEKNVMRRVHTIHALRPFVSFGGLAALVVLIAVWGISREVWVARVLENMPQGNLIALSRFSLAAFDHARLVVQALSLLTLASLLYLARETARAMSSAFTLVRA